MKKSFVIILALLFCFLFTSCFYEESIGQPLNNDEEIIIKWLVYGEEYQDTQSVINEFNKQLAKRFSNTKVEFEFVSKENYKTIWDMKMATDEAFDLAWISNENFNYTEEVKKGSLMALDYLLLSTGQGLLDNIPEELWEYQVKDGNTFAIPVDGILYRKSLSFVTKKNYADYFEQFDEIGKINISSKYTDKACYEAFEPYLEYAKNTESIGMGVSYKNFESIADKGLEGIYGSDSPFVIKIFDNEVKVYNKYKLDIYRDYFETMAKWYSLGYIREDVSQVINPSSEDGKQGGSILFLDEYSDYIESDERIMTEYEAVYVPLEDYKYIGYDSCRNSIVIPKNSENPQRAIQIVDYLNSESGKELYRLLVNGIEKEHYILLDNGTIVRRRDNDDKLLYILSKQNLGNGFQNFELKEGQFDKLREENDEAVVSKLVGFNLDTRMIVINLEKVDLVIAEYKENLCQGNSEDWEAAYNEFMSKMDEGGSEQIIDEIQRQIDIFMATQQ